MLESFGTFLTRKLHKHVYLNTCECNIAQHCTHSVGSGEWSSEGIQVISNITRGNVTTVLCNSTHLTSFAVLVDVAGGLEVRT